MGIEQGLDWIDEQQGDALRLLQEWVAINSWSENLQGLAEMQEELKRAFSPLADSAEVLQTEKRVGNALLFRKRGGSSRKVLLGGHMDTVHSPALQFLTSRISGEHCIGPGVTDMKGGLAVMWLALSAFEKFYGDLDLGWVVLINGDEELGSPGSHTFWEEKAKEAHLCLLFEPSFPDGALVDTRKGAFNMSLFVKGVAAHAGRSASEGRSAVKAISRWIVQAFEMAKRFPELTLNVAKLHSESPLNIVPADARVSLNVRSFNGEDLEQIQKELDALSRKIEEEEGVVIHSQMEGMKVPKVFTQETEALFEGFQKCAKELGMAPLKRRASGGLSDGNFTAAVGIPTLDTLGVIGGNLHTRDEYMVISSLAERAKLVLLFLYRVAKGEI